MPTTIEQVVEKLKEAGLKFKLASEVLKMVDSVPSGATVICIMTPEMYWLNPKHDGYLAKDNFTLTSISGHKRFAVICKVVITCGQIVFHSSPRPITRKLTSKMSDLVKGTVGSEIENSIDCWEAMIPTARQTL